MGFGQRAAAAVVVGDDLTHHRNPLRDDGTGYLSAVLRDARRPAGGDTHVHVTGPVNLTIDPKNASKDTVLQSILSRSGISKHSPILPSPLTVGGAAFNR